MCKLGMITVCLLLSKGERTYCEDEQNEEGIGKGREGSFIGWLEDLV